MKQKREDILTSCTYIVIVGYTRRRDINLATTATTPTGDVSSNTVNINTSFIAEAFVGYLGSSTEQGNKEE